MLGVFVPETVHVVVNLLTLIELAKRQPKVYSQGHP